MIAARPTNTNVPGWIVVLLLGTLMGATAGLSSSAMHARAVLDESAISTGATTAPTSTPPPADATPASEPKPLSKSSVGLPQRINQIVLPGTELEVRPSEDHDEPLVLRIVATYKHGTAYRYD